MSTRPEADFVRLCVREPEFRSRETLERAAERVRDWALVARLAIRHRVAAYVLESGKQGGMVVPAACRDALSQDVFAATAVALLLDSGLQRLGEAAQSSGIPVLVLKGPALARTLYSARPLRPFSDIDLVVREPDEARMIEVLSECGYVELEFEAGDAQRRYTAQHSDCGAFHRLFGGAGGRALIELHLDPLQLGVKPACETDRWARSVPVEGLPGVSMLGPEDQVVHLSVHAQKHGFSRLIWLKDLDLLVRRTPDLDWDLVIATARREGVSGSVWYSLSLASELLHTPVPAVTRGLRPSVTTRVLYGAAWNKRRIADLEGFMRRRGVQFYAGEAWRGTLPSLLFMGRRRVRAGLIVGNALRCATNLNVRTAARPALALRQFLRSGQASISTRG